MGTYYKHVHVKLASIVRFYVQEKLLLMQLVLCIRYMYCVLYCKYTVLISLHAGTLSHHS